MADSNSKSKGKFISEMYDSTNILISDILTSIETNSNDPTDKSAVDLLKTIRDLQQQVMEQKKWAQRKVCDAACRLSNDYFELQTLRGWKAAQDKTENKTDDSENLIIAELTKEYVQHAKSQTNIMADCAKRLEMKNAQIWADTRALELTGSESNKALQQVLERERKCMKRIAGLEKQTQNLHAQCEDEELRALEMEGELVRAQREAKEVEVQWKQETREKECMLMLVAEETRKSKTQKARSRAHLSRLCGEVETEVRVAEDECRRLEDELARLRVSCMVEDLLPKELSFLYNYDEATSSESSARSESKCRICMICMQNEVSVVLLPCTHYVLCFLCYERNCRAVGASCPYCHVEIKQSIKVYAD